MRFLVLGFGSMLGCCSPCQAMLRSVTWQRLCRTCTCRSHTCKPCLSSRYLSPPAEPLMGLEPFPDTPQTWNASRLLIQGSH